MTAISLERFLARLLALVFSGSVKNVYCKIGKLDVLCSRRAWGSLKLLSVYTSMWQCGLRTNCELSCLIGDSLIGFKFFKIFIGAFTDCHVISNIPLAYDEPSANRIALRDFPPGKSNTSIDVNVALQLVPNDYIFCYVTFLLFTSACPSLIKAGCIRKVENNIKTAVLLMDFISADVHLIA